MQPAARLAPLLLPPCLSVSSVVNQSHAPKKPQRAPRNTEKPHSPPKIFDGGSERKNYIKMNSAKSACILSILLVVSVLTFWLGHHLHERKNSVIFHNGKFYRGELRGEAFTARYNESRAGSDENQRLLYRLEKALRAWLRVTSKKSSWVPVQPFAGVEAIVDEVSFMGPVSEEELRRLVKLFQVALPDDAILVNSKGHEHREGRQVTGVFQLSPSEFESLLDSLRSSWDKVQAFHLAQYAGKKDPYYLPRFFAQSLEKGRSTPAIIHAGSSWFEIAFPERDVLNYHLFFDPINYQVIIYFHVFI